MNYKKLVSVAILLIVVTLLLTNGIAKITEKDFIEETFNITYKEATEFVQNLESERVTLNRGQQNIEDEQSPNIYSYGSEELIKLMDEKYEGQVESGYLEKMLINGDLTEIYFLSLEKEKDYLVENIELEKEEKNKDTIEQNWTFTLIEKVPEDDSQNNKWTLNATIYRSISTKKITYFKLQDKPYYND